MNNTDNIELTLDYMLSLKIQIELENFINYNSQNTLIFIITKMYDFLKEMNKNDTEIINAINLLFDTIDPSQKNNIQLILNQLVESITDPDPEDNDTLPDLVPYDTEPTNTMPITVPNTTPTVPNTTPNAEPDTEQNTELFYPAYRNTLLQFFDIINNENLELNNTIDIYTNEFINPSNNIDSFFHNLNNIQVNLISSNNERSITEMNTIITNNINEDIEETNESELPDLVQEQNNTIRNNNIFTTITYQMTFLHNFLPINNNTNTVVKETTTTDILNTNTILQNFNEYSTEIKEQYKTCTLCLDDYNNESLIRQLKCNHFYHKDCIDPWVLNENYKCPICRDESLGNT
jgi:hypothetical protein